MSGRRVAAAPMARVEIAPATACDVDALHRIEQASFDGDWISRRSFQRLIKSESAAVLIARLDGEPVGGAVLTWRRGVAVARLYSLAVLETARGAGVGAALFDAAERAAEAQDMALLRLEVSERNAAARGLYERRGYRAIGRLPDYYFDGAAAIRMEKALRFAPAPENPPPYYAQTTEFTCGPACLMMARAHLAGDQPPSELQEIRLWRQTTTVFMTAGHGGCDPVGMALLLDSAGLAVEVRVSERGPLFLKTVASEQKRRVMRLAQQDFRHQAAARGVPLDGAPLAAAELAPRLRSGALAIVLISGNRMLGERSPHWVLAHGADARHLFIHDPWVEPDRNETEMDAINLPIPFAEFDRMARWGASRLRAMVIAEKRGAS